MPSLINLKDAVYFVDLSHWNGPVDWSILSKHRVVGMIAKATQGNYSRDDRFQSHYQAAHAAGRLVGAYVWDDPNVTGESEAAFFLETIKGCQIDFFAVDAEQYWGNDAWNNPGSHIILPGEVSAHAYKVAKLLFDATGKPVLVYSGGWFIKDHAPGMIKWLKAWPDSFPFWMASYIKGGGMVSWEELEKRLPNVTPQTPDDIPIVMWQFSSNYVVPGYSSGVDLNLVPGGLPVMLKLAGRDKMPDGSAPEPLPESPRFKVRTMASRGLNVRIKPLVKPETLAGVLLPMGSIEDTYDTLLDCQDIWYRIKIDGADRWIAGKYQGAVLSLPFI